MNIVIIGNGPAGTQAASKIRSLDKNVNITIFSYENYPYYARPRLPEIIEGKVNIDQIIVFKKEWYEKNNIQLIISKNVDKIDTLNKAVICNNEKYDYDKLLIAVGAQPNILNIKGISDNKIYTLRTIDDAIEIKKQIIDKEEIIIIGGGLLGLELANSIITNKKIVKIIEVNQCLLNRQIDEIKGKKLQNILENKGYIFYLCETCEEIYKKDNKFTVRSASGKNINGDMIIISSGIKTRLDLAVSANLNINKGIIVDKYLTTSNKDIYAAGDCIEYNNQLWGFVKSSIEQGNIAGENMLLNNIKEYNGTKIDFSLKISGIDLNTL